MTSVLPIGVDLLLSGGVESSRLEFKASWDPERTGPQVLTTLCAFANDLQNLNGGYVLIGVAEREGMAVRPVKGVPAEQLDEAQKWIRGNCNRIEPVYMPVMDVVEVDGQKILALWASASDVRPHQAPGRHGKDYFIRIGSETIAAKDELLRQLIGQSARVPFDDRRAMGAEISDLRLSLAHEFLHDVGSDLQREASADRVFDAMQITRPMNGHKAPRNVGLLLFSGNPERWFSGARIEVVRFSDEAGDSLEEMLFRGPLHVQVQTCLTWLEGQVTRHTEKVAGPPEARVWSSYPMPAIREALVNAVYHRSYESSEPVKVYIYPDRVEVISYPGPVGGVELVHLAPGGTVPPVPARNRRIGEFFKELGLAEGRGTGVPKILRAMRANGSPDPRYDFDAGRSYFRVTLPAHPDHLAIVALRGHAYHRAVGDGEAR